MKRNEHLQPLSHNHYDGLVIAYRMQAGLRNGADTDTIRDYALHFWKNGLQQHCEQEEAHLLPELRRLGAETLARRLLSDHRRLTGLIDRLRNATYPQAALKELSEMMREHIRFEERELFPFLEEQLPEARLRQIGKYLHADHQPSDKDWMPAFWA